MSHDLSNSSPGNEQLLKFYETMCLIRGMELQLAEDKASGSLPGTVHLYVGQEAVAVGVCAHLTDADYITSTHRGHGHFLAKGGEPKAMMAEIWAKKTGICKGMGGSMHVADVSKGILGANGIVGGGMAIAAGAAFAAKLSAARNVAVSFFGDGASNQGVLMETLNVAALWKLPLIFACENNQYSEFTPSREVTAGKISARAEAFGIPTENIDGNDVVEVWKAMARAVDRARADEGPTFIEANTYRIHGHAEAEKNFLGPGKYREDAEIEEWKFKDPIDRLRNELIRSIDDGAAKLKLIDDRIARSVREASEFAKASEPADPMLSFDLMFTNQKA